MNNSPRLKPLRNLFSLPKIIYTVDKNIRVQEKFLTTYISPILKDAEMNNDGSLDENDFKKITRYYGLAVPAILGEAFCALHGKKMTDTERWGSTCQGAMTGLFDDFYDKEKMDDAQIGDTLSDQNKVKKKSNEKLFDIFYLKAQQHAPDAGKMNDLLLRVHEAQLESKLQLNPLLSLDSIDNITRKKGGISLLFYRSMILPEPTDNQIALLYELGGLMQFANDLFDVYKDREAGIRTLVTESSRIAFLRNEFRSQLAAAYGKAYQLGFNPANVYKFLSSLSIGIFSRCFVCFDHLESAEKKTSGKFSIHSYTRCELICDMDTKKNMLRSAAYHVRTIF